MNDFLKPIYKQFKMKVNMKKNRVYASALAAVVLLAAGCSDDLDDSGNGTTGGELNGTKTYMKVSVNPGVVTKAAAGEEGDTPNGEEGKADEYAVKDVTVVLFRNAGDTYAEPTEFNHDSKLVAAGFGTLPGNMDPSNEDWHKRMATVTLEVTQDEEDFDQKTYGIIAVTNLGDEAGKALVAKVSGENASVKNGADLANLLQEKYKTGSGFIMSTHNDQYGTSAKIFDKVKLVANVNPNEAPQASVHVERLAAKVRISKAEDVSDFIYTAKEGNTDVAKIRLDGVALVNQLSSGSFLLKRVTSETTDGTIPAMTDGHDLYLGNETVQNDAAATNYVIDPWTRNKKVTDGMDWTNLAISSETLADAKNLSYTNPFVGDNFKDMWNSYSEGWTTLANNANFADADKLDFAYTMENTTSAVMSKNGFSTGALFKATYIPKELMTVTTEEGKSKVEPKPVANYNPDGDELTYDAIAADSDVTLDFYLYGNNAYDSYKAIFNEYVWGEQKELDGVQDATIISYDDLVAASIGSVDKAKFFDQLGTNDPLGYIAAMRKAADTDKSGELSEQEISAATLTGIDTYINDESNAETLNANINKFEDCVCYYPYWIRHADNNNSTDMGVMEFAIVRNNIYDLKVTGISGYGYSGIEKPEPGTDDETKKFYFNVDIFVKNWVVRSNDDIIL